MDDKIINLGVGNRLRAVRMVFNEGRKLSSDQFAYLLNETRDRIINYELGRAALPLRVIIELYERGINPMYLILGEGEMYADNKAGKTLRKKILSKQSAKLSGRIAKMERIRNNSGDESLEIPMIRVSAGKIPESSTES